MKENKKKEVRGEKEERIERMKKKTVNEERN